MRAGVIYNIVLHIRLGKWEYTLGLYPLLWKLWQIRRYVTVDDTLMIMLFCGPFILSVSHHTAPPPPPHTILREVETTEMDELEARGLCARVTQ